MLEDIEMTEIRIMTGGMELGKTRVGILQLPSR